MIEVAHRRAFADIAVRDVEIVLHLETSLSDIAPSRATIT